VDRSRRRVERDMVGTAGPGSRPESESPRAAVLGPVG
jgi:hypothetical protein